MASSQDQSYLIDVRTPAEFLTGALNKATNVEYQNIAHYIIDEQCADKDADIALYCRSGRRSGIAKAELESLGFTGVRDLGSIDEARDVLEREALEKSNDDRMVRKDDVVVEKVEIGEKGEWEVSTKALLDGLKDLGDEEA